MDIYVNIVLELSGLNTMWEDESEEEDNIEYNSDKVQELLLSFQQWLKGEDVFLSENELEYLFNHYYFGEDVVENADFYVDKIIETGLQMYPLSSFFHIAKARIFIDKLDYKKAITHLERAQVLDPTFTDIEIMLSDCYEELGDIKTALEKIKIASKSSDSFSLDISNRYYSLLDQLSMENEAVKVLRDIISHEINNKELELYIAVSYDENHMLIALSQLLDINPFNADFWLLKGKTELKINEFTDAIKSFEYAHYLNDTDNEALYLLGLAYIGIADYTNGKEYMSEAAEAGFDQIKCALQTAVCMNRSGDYIQARFLLQCLPTDNSEIADQVALEIGFSYLHQGQAYKALPYLVKAVKNTGRLDSRIILAETYLKLDKIDKVYDTFKASVSFKSTDPDTFYSSYFSIFYRLGDVYKMEQLYAMAMDENITDDDFHHQLLLIMGALIEWLKNNQKSFESLLITCFSIDADQACDILEHIDLDLLSHPQIISIKQLF
jgi:tetratricopeptide (TPR) repeat protein